MKNIVCIRQTKSELKICFIILKWLTNVPLRWWRVPGLWPILIYVPLRWWRVSGLWQDSVYLCNVILRWWRVSGLWQDSGWTWKYWWGDIWVWNWFHQDRWRHCCQVIVYCNVDYFQHRFCNSYFKVGLLTPQRRLCDFNNSFSRISSRISKKGIYKKKKIVLMTLYYSFLHFNDITYLNQTKSLLFNQNSCMVPKVFLISN